jgi:hypothetical protein
VKEAGKHLLKFRQVGVLHGKGKLVKDAVRQFGVTEQTHVKWIST